MKILFTGGGTAGHIMPIVAIIREIKKAYPSPAVKLYYFGPKHKYGTVLLSKENVKVKNILTGKFRRYFSLKNFIDVFKIPIGCVQSFFLLFFLAPDVIFSKGGYGSFPTVFSAGILRIPLILHEADSVPGLASKITSKWAAQIFTSFKDTPGFSKQKTICLGNPIRKSLLDGSKEKAKELFNLKGEKPLILILGGSQGSQRINNLILGILPELLKQFEIIHQTGVNNQQSVIRETNALLPKDAKQYYHSLPFLNEEQMKHSLAICNLVISRAGAGAIFEIAAAKKPAILIPLTNSAQDHQVKNAYAFANSGAGEVIEEANLKPNFFLQKVETLIRRPELMQTMSQNSAAFSKPLAAQKIAKYIIEYLT